MNVYLPEITTVIPTFRRPHLLRRAIQSVLNQTYPEFQVWVYDDASGDETSAVVSEMAQRDQRVHYYCHPRNIGMIANFSYAIEGAQSPYFSMLCDDDLLLPGFYKTALESFKAHPGAAFVSTSVVLLNKQGILTGLAPNMPPGFYSPPNGVLAMAHFSKAWFAGTLYRRDVVDSIGAHDQQFSGASDVDFDFRIAARFPFYITAEPGAVFSVHESSTSVRARHDFVWRDMLKLIRKLSDDESIPLACRTLVAEILSHKLEHYMFQLGIVYVLRGQWNEARHIANIFHTHYHRYDKAIFLSALTTTSQHIPPVYQVLQAAQKFRKSRHGRQVSQMYPALQQDLAWINDKAYVAMQPDTD